MDTREFKKISRANPAVKKILAMTFPSYKGRKIVWGFAESIRFSDTNWSGGTLREYKALVFNGSSCNVVTVPRGTWYAPNDIEQRTCVIPANGMIVEHVYFCGHDLGVRIYVGQAVQTMLEAPQKLLA